MELDGFEDQRCAIGHVLEPRFGRHDRDRLVRAGLADVTPILAVRGMDEAANFYEAAGFNVDRYDDGYAFVEYADASVFDLGVEQVEPSINRGSCYMIVSDPDSWHQRLSDAGLPVSAIEDQTHGMREFTLVDPSGNRLRIGRSI